jgi:ligand-binding sensor domain-containing protein
MKFYFCLTFFICGFIHSYGQTPFFQNYALGSKKQPVEVNAMVQDPDGFLWFGTSNGLYRFDGNTTTLYTIADSIAHKEITAVTIDSLGRIWAGHKNGAITYLDHHALKKFEPKEGTTSEQISDIMFDKSGTLWFSTLNDGLYYFRNDRLYRVDDQEGLPDLYVYDIALDSSGRIFAGTDRGMAICSLIDNRVSIETVDYKDGLPDNIIRKIFLVDDVAWIATEDAGIAKYDIRNKKVEHIAKGWSYGTTTDLLVKDSEIWLATAKGLLLFNYASGHTSTYYHSNTASLNSLLQDREGNIWIAGATEVIRTAGNGIGFIDLPSHFGSASMLAVTKDFDGNIWYSTDDGLFKGTVQQGTFSSEQKLLRSPFEKYSVITLYTDEQGAIWAGLYGEGVLRIDPKTEKVKHFQRELRNGNVLNVTGAENTIWLATLGGATRIVMNGDNFDVKNFSREDGLASDFIYNIFSDRKGRVWFATDGKGVDMLDEKGFHHFENGLPSKVVYGVTEDKNGNIWANVQGNGLWIFDNANSFTESNVKARAAEIHSLTTDKDGNIVALHDLGMDVIAADGERVKYFSDESGFEGRISNLNAVTKDNYGNMYFGTSKGIIRYSSTRQHFTNQPLAKITAVKIYNQAVDKAEITSLSYDQDNLTFNFVGLWYQNPTSLFFRYKLENYDHDWIATSDNSVIYSKLPPGDYTFRVSVSETMDFNQPNENSLSFTIYPPFWRTNWFYFLASIALSVGGYSLVKYRERKLRYNNMLLEARVKARTREVQRQNDEIQAQNEEITAQAEEIKGINENLEMLVQERTAELLRKNQALEEYAFINAHKLRSPVASILGLAHLMSKTNLDPEGQEINKRLQQAVDELDDVVRSITKAIESGDRIPFKH